MLLQFAGKTVGEISAAFESDGTWFATFHAAVQGPDHEQVAQFIRFCQDWNGRCAEDQADAAEFDNYSRFLGPGMWSLEDDSGCITKIETPMFLDGMSGEITWVTE